VIWVAFSSTSKTVDKISPFFDRQQGTLIAVDAIEGKDITAFSHYGEDEVLLLPNCFLKVANVVTSEMKKVMQIVHTVPEKVDIIQLKQNKTPEFLLSWFLET